MFKRCWAGPLFAVFAVVGLCPPFYGVKAAFAQNRTVAPLAGAVTLLEDLSGQPPGATDLNVAVAAIRWYANEIETIALDKLIGGKDKFAEIRARLAAVRSELLDIVPPAPTACRWGPCPAGNCSPNCDPRHDPLTVAAGASLEQHIAAIRSYTNAIENSALEKLMTSLGAYTQIQTRLSSALHALNKL